jgi:CheY-like chemotaxis protein
MNKKILLVDDDPSVLYTIKNGLEAYGTDLKIDTCDNGVQAIDFLKNNNAPDLIILDIMMPGKSGWSTLNTIKENDLWKDIPIFFLTARTDQVAKDAGSFLADEFIEKPANIQELKVKIDKIFLKQIRND